MYSEKNFQSVWEKFWEKIISKKKVDKTYKTSKEK